MLSPGEIAPGQWVMEFGPIPKKEEEKDFQKEPSPFELISAITAPPPQHPSRDPYIVLAVELPFVVVANCTLVPAIPPFTKIFRTDETLLRRSQRSLRKLSIQVGSRLENL